MSNVVKVVKSIILLAIAAFIVMIIVGTLSALSAAPGYTLATSRAPAATADEAGMTMGNPAAVSKINEHDATEAVTGGEEPGVAALDSLSASLVLSTPDEAAAAAGSQSTELGSVAQPVASQPTNNDAQQAQTNDNAASQLPTSASPSQKDKATAAGNSTVEAAPSALSPPAPFALAPVPSAPSGNTAAPTKPAPSSPPAAKPQKTHHPAWDEWVEEGHWETVTTPAIYGQREVYGSICNECGADICGRAAQHLKETHHSGYHEGVVGYEEYQITPEKTEQVWVDTSHWVNHEEYWD
ncbi:MAG: hypothetical protein LBC35_07750 [Coriobacteriales bacterium]|jgi:hypothetical protein|nr:hypothetical protein [Coriobacteriales bacterium]